MPRRGEAYTPPLWLYRICNLDAAAIGLLGAGVAQNVHHAIQDHWGVFQATLVVWSVELVLNKRGSFVWVGF